MVNKVVFILPKFEIGFDWVCLGLFCMVVHGSLFDVRWHKFLLLPLLCSCAAWQKLGLFCTKQADL